ncbi:hypothetical protein [Cotesia plutellae polydnavirus]|nr:hypothetical protein [Cotesia plutellae polydnavirus]
MRQIFFEQDKTLVDQAIARLLSNDHQSTAKNGSYNQKAKLDEVIGLQNLIEQILTDNLLPQEQSTPYQNIKTKNLRGVKGHPDGTKFTIAYYSLQ